MKINYFVLFLTLNAKIFALDVIELNTKNGNPFRTDLQRITWIKCYVKLSPQTIIEFEEQEHYFKNLNSWLKPGDLVFIKGCRRELGESFAKINIWHKEHRDPDVDYIHCVIL